jgi:hypothetical protein
MRNVAAPRPETFVPKRLLRSTRNPHDKQARRERVLLVYEEAVVVSIHVRARDDTGLTLVLVAENEIAAAMRRVP